MSPAAPTAPRARSACRRRAGAASSAWPNFPRASAARCSDNETVLRDFGIGADVARGHPPRHPAIHRTRSIDYVTVLEGEIDLLLDDGEVRLKAGDVVVQQGNQPRMDQPGHRHLPPGDGVHRC